MSSMNLIRTDETDTILGFEVKGVSCVLLQSNLTEERLIFLQLWLLILLILCPVQTSNFSCAESNANEQEQ